jgi:DNA-binding transcriptional regulator LsrR (DeoR family)
LSIFWGSLHKSALVFIHQQWQVDLNEHIYCCVDVLLVFEEDGSFDNIPLNKRASGPNLDLFRQKFGVCVVSGLAKVRGLHAALRGKLMTELITDEPTARALVERYL